MSEFKRINKNTILAQLRRGEPWEGYIVGCKVAPQCITGSWHLGSFISVHTLFELEAACNSWSYYNSCHELGYKPAFYVEA